MPFTMFTGIIFDCPYAYSGNPYYRLPKLIHVLYSMPGAFTNRNGPNNRNGPGITGTDLTFSLFCVNK